MNTCYKGEKIIKNSKTSDATFVFKPSHFKSGFFPAEWDVVIDIVFKASLDDPAIGFH